MNNQDFTTTIVVNSTPEAAYQAINNVRGWWLGQIEGPTDQLNDEFSYRNHGIHYSKHRVTELVPGKKVAWLTTDSSLEFVEDKNEWTGTSITFDIADAGNQTEIRFTHHGLVPGCPCFGACSGGWTHFINGSLQSFIDTGKGKPM